MPPNNSLRCPAGSATSLAAPDERMSVAVRPVLPFGDACAPTVG